MCEHTILNIRLLFVNKNNSKTGYKMCKFRYRLTDNLVFSCIFCKTLVNLKIAVDFNVQYN